MQYRFCLRLLFAALCLFVVSPAAHASAELRGALREFAADVKKLLDGRGETTIAAKFTGPTTFPTSASPGIVQILQEELHKLDITLKDRAKFGINGVYKLAELPAENADDKRLGVKVLAIKLHAVIVDQFDNPIANFLFERVIRGEATVLTTLGLPAALDPNGTERERDKELRARLNDPKTKVQGSTVRSNAKSLYAIEILVESKAKDAQNKDGLAFVPIKRGETYAVRLINDSPHEAAVQLRIDGLSMFAFSQLRNKGEPLYSVVLVPAGKSVTIPGWHVTNKETDKFQVTEYAKSASAAVSNTSNLGTITATFQAAWPENAKAPADEPGKKRSVGSGDATGFGPRIDVQYQEVRRNLGVIRDSVSVRYTK